MSDSASVDVTVVVPCYNHGGFLREAIESAEKSHGVRFEIVVVDDGSSDRTAAIAAEYPACTKPVGHLTGNPTSAVSQAT